MNCKIAVYVNDQGETAAMHEAGVVKIYVRQRKLWYLVHEYAMNIHLLNGMRAIRESLLELAEKMEDCKIFVAKDLTGITYGIFDSLGFSLWEIEGRPEDLLEQVFIKEEEEVMKAAKEFQLEGMEASSVIESEFQKTREGCYLLDLKKIQESEGGKTSKQVLKPFLLKGEFHELKVLCSHMPGWLEEEIFLLNFELLVEKSSASECSFVIRSSKSRSRH